MYYLQSRYYDPEVGRFLNADALITSDHGLLGNNMLVYCLNNPVNCFDNTGKDAIWIQESGSAFTMGHSGLFVQDSDGNWWYFYWGPANQNADIVEMISGTPAVCILEQVDISDLSLYKTRNRKQLHLLFVQHSNGYNGTFFGDQCVNITDVIYFYGDYSDTYEFLRDLQEKAENDLVQYKLLDINCCQVSCQAMAQSDLRFNYVLALIPNIAYSAYVGRYSPYSRSFLDYRKALIE